MSSTRRRIQKFLPEEAQKAETSIYQFRLNSMIIKVPVYVEILSPVTPEELPFVVEYLTTSFSKDLRKKIIPKNIKLDVNGEELDQEIKAKIVTKQRAFDVLRTGR